MPSPRRRGGQNSSFWAYDRAVRPALALSLGVPFAHPLSEPFHLPISPLLAANLAALVVFVAAFAVRAARRRPEGADTASWAGTLSGAQVATRAVAVGLLALAIAAGRLGTDDELENLAPALVVGAVWPLAVLASVTLGAVWRWVDPWDGVARALSRGGDEKVAGHVWPAVAPAVAWVWYLSAYSDPLDPRSVGAVVALYTVVTVAGCLALGRSRWLAMGEPFGIVLSWMALLPRGRLAAWQPPRGAETLLGVLAGGVLFGALRRSELWGGLNTVQPAELVSTLGVLASCAAIVALLRLAAAADGSAAAAAVPVVAAVIVAVAMDRNRLFTSVQLLPGLLGDPLGQGWDLLGRAGAGLDPAPLGARGLLAAQLAVLVAGHLAGAVVLARRVARNARTPLAAVLGVLAGVSVIAVLSH